MMQSGIITDITAYKIIQITTGSEFYKLFNTISHRLYKVYNTKHGSFRDTDIGVTVFCTKEQANENLRRN